MGAKIKKNTIVINGREYDSKTGLPVNIVTPTTTKRPATADNKKEVSKTTSSREPTKTASVAEEVKATSTQKNTKDTLVVKDTKSAKDKEVLKAKKTTSRSLGSISKSTPKRVQKSKTLVRSLVKKPVKPAKAKPTTSTLKQPAKIIVQGRSGKHITAKPQTLRSTRISRFNNESLTKRTADIPVVSAPTSSPTRAAQPKRATKSNSYDINDTPPLTKNFVRKSSPSSATSNANIFEDAIKNAMSHKSIHIDKKIIKKGRKFRNIGIAVAILAIFFTYQNSAQIALRQAESTIGFKASIPTHTPAGFSRSSKVQYQKGMVVINFNSNSDDRQFTVTQSSTELDNVALANEYLTEQEKSFETKTVKGKPIYIYDNTRATWIQHGVWYTIDGNAGLSKDQLTEIASSLI